MRPFGKSWVSTTVDQQRPDSHLIHQLIHIFDEIGLHIDSMRSQENTNMVRGNTKPAPWGKHTKNKCPAPAQRASKWPGHRIMIVTEGPLRAATRANFFSRTCRSAIFLASRSQPVVYKTIWRNAMLGQGNFHF